MWIGIICVLLTVVVYIGSRYVNQKVASPLLNPILVTIVLLIGILKLMGIDYETYNSGGQWITYILGPIVVLLSVPLYENRATIKKHLVPISVGILSGIVTSIFSVWILCKLFGLDEIFVESLFAKSITTPLAIEVTKMLEGVSSITIVAVIVTGIIGATIAPFIIKVMGIDHPISKGIGIGTASHGIGTSKAVEMGNETAGASGLAMGITGIATVIIASIFFG